MSLVQCVVSGCRWMVREGLRRSGEGVHGQELADGRTCWRCRRRSADFDRKCERLDKRRMAAAMARHAKPVERVHARRLSEAAEEATAQGKLALGERRRKEAARGRVR